eukprot:12692188-Ditylum_brightwellii.AAC.1
MSVGSSKCHFHNETLKSPKNDISRSNHSSHHLQYQYLPPLQAQQYTSMPGHCAPRYYFGPPKDDCDGSTINYWIVLIICAAFLTILHISMSSSSSSLPLASSSGTMSSSMGLTSSGMMSGPTSSGMIDSLF